MKISRVSNLIEEINNVGEFQAVAPVSFSDNVKDIKDQEKKAEKVLKEKEKEIRNLDNTEIQRKEGSKIVRSNGSNKLHLEESLFLENLDWDYFDKFDSILETYMPVRGEGDTVASLAVTAVNKIIYKWYNDGDVYDNRYALPGWANDLSSYANWLYSNIPETEEILERILDIRTENQYEREILKPLADLVFNEAFLSIYNLQKQGSIYSSDGPFEWVELEDEDEEELEDEDEEELEENLDSSEDFEPFFFKDEDGDFFREESSYYIEKLDPVKYMDDYDSFRDFVDNEFSKKVLGSWGNELEMDELYKYYTILAPKQTKIGLRLWGEKKDLDEEMAEEDRFDFESAIYRAVLDIIRKCKRKGIEISLDDAQNALEMTSLRMRDDDELNEAWRNHPKENDVYLVSKTRKPVADLILEYLIEGEHEWGYVKHSNGVINPTPLKGAEYDAHLIGIDKDYNITVRAESIKDLEDAKKIADKFYKKYSIKDYTGRAGAKRYPAMLTIFLEDKDWDEPYVDPKDPVYQGEEMSVEDKEVIDG